MTTGDIASRTVYSSERVWRAELADVEEGIRPEQPTVDGRALALARRRVGAVAQTMARSGRSVGLTNPQESEQPVAEDLNAGFGPWCTDPALDAAPSGWAP